MQARLIKVIPETSHIKTFVFDPDGEFTYSAGQYVYLTLKNVRDDKRGNTRQFTLSSSPTEKNISITTTISKSPYKDNLNRLNEGDMVDIDGPHGTFIFTESSKSNHLFIAGGIGVTPYRSFIKYTIDAKNTKNITLFLSVKDLGLLPFRKNFFNWAKNNNNIDLQITLTGNDIPENWGGFSGRIDKNMISETLDGLDKPREIWLSGSPKFVNHIEDLLYDLGLRDLMTDKFTGY